MTSAAQPTALLVDNKLANASGLENKLKERLERRLSKSSDYSAKEIQEIDELNPYLFPANFRLEKADAAAIRSICTLSQTELKPARSITSHRKLIGPIIVAIKKATWPMIKFHLTDSFKGIGQFNSWAVHTICKLLSDQRQLQKRIGELEKEIESLKNSRSS
jgi:hypothetical protein